MRTAGYCAQRLLLPPSAGICRGTRSFKAARPNFHQSSSLRQSPASGGAVARGDFDRPSTCPAADEEARAMGGQTNAEHQQAASGAPGLPIPSARQDDRPAEQVWAADVTVLSALAPGGGYQSSWGTLLLVLGG